MTKPQPIHIVELVIDTSIAVSAGSSATPRAEDSISCRDFLTFVEQQGHHIAFTAETMAEWRSHRNEAGFARGWLQRMFGSKRVHILGADEKIGVRQALRSRIEEIAATKVEKEQGEIVKDIHLLEAAVATDNIVISCERRARAFYAATSAMIKELCSIVWVRIGKPERLGKQTVWMMDGEEIITWLADVGAGNPSLWKELILGYGVEQCELATHYQNNAAQAYTHAADDEGGLTVKERLTFVDGLRGLAVLMVVLHHTWLFGGLYRFGPGMPPASYWFATFSVGVNLFMVISGFCLTLPLVALDGWREMDVADFFRRRVVRIVPPYFAAIALIALLGWLVPLLYSGHATAFTKPQLLGIGGHLLFSYNILAGFDANAPSLNGSFWSIELEAHFYLLLPLLIVAARRWGLVRVTAAVVLLSLAFRAWVWYTIDDFDNSAMYVFLARSAPARLSEFVFGICAAVVYVRYRQRINVWLMLGAATVLLWLGLGYLFVQLGHFSPATDIVVGAGFACLLLAGSVAGPVQRVLSWRPLAGLGLISYSVYLIHEPVVKELFIWQRGRQGWEAFLTYSVGSTVVAIAISYVFYRLVEQPALRWGKRMVRRQPAPVVAAEAVEAHAAP